MSESTIDVGIPDHPRTLAEKVWDDHLVVKGENGQPDLIYIDLHLVHEVTSPQAFDGLRAEGRPVRRLDLTIATEDHNTPTLDIDKPIAGLIQDLKQRGMLDRTLIVWTSEFGRTPFNVNANHAGREHHKFCFSSWMAGGGVKGGMVYGTSDEYGIRAAENSAHTHDLHATILHQLGLDHERLTYRHAGRDFRLTDVRGEVLHDVLHGERAAG